MKILFITDRYTSDLGGAAKSAERISKILADAGNTIHILHLSTTLNAGEIISNSDDSGRIIHQIGLFPEFDTAMQWVELIINGLHRKVDFDIIHGHGLFPAGFLAVYCSKLNKLKSITSIRGNDLDRGIHRSDTFQHLIWTLENADLISTVSTEAANKSAVLSNRKSGIIYTPNGVDTQIFTPRKKNQQLLTDLNINDAKIFLFTGEMRFKKGQPFIFEAFRELNVKFPCKLLIVGEVRDNIEKENYLLKYPELRDKIIFIPYMTDEYKLSELYNICDFFFSPSLWDGMPNSVLEAMACGKIVIGTKTGGIPDMITHGENGILISPDDLPRLGEACIELINLPDNFLQEMSANARNTILDQFTLHHESAMWINIYKTLY